MRMRRIPSGHLFVFLASALVLLLLSSVASLAAFLVVAYKQNAK